MGGSPTGGAAAGVTSGDHGRKDSGALPESRPCRTCTVRLRVALEYAAACRAPVADRKMGPQEAAAWAELQANSYREVAQAVSGAAHCHG